jgi:hypothetical protein
VLPPDIKKYEINNKDGSYVMRGIGKSLDIKEYSRLVKKLSDEGDEKLEYFLEEKYFEPFYYLLLKHSDTKAIHNTVMDLVFNIVEPLSISLKNDASRLVRIFWGF